MRIVVLKDGTYHELKAGDVFSWSYTQGYCQNNKGNLYWCMSRMCKYRDGNLYDLFWNMGGPSSSNSPLNPNNIELTFLGNLKNYDEVSSYTFQYYDEKDILDLRHSNHGEQWGKCCYLRKGACKSKEKLYNVLKKQKEDAEYQIRSGEKDLKLVEAKLTSLESNDTDIDNIRI